MPEFRLPTTPEEWAAIEPNESDRGLVVSWAREDPRCNSLSAESLAAAARLLGRERCIAALATHLFDGSESMSVAQSEARRILEEA